jgi:hypothetical protein
LDEKGASGTELTMVKAQAYPRAGKTKKSAMLDDLVSGRHTAGYMPSVQALHLMVNWFLPSQKLLRGERTGSHITKVHDTAQTPCARMLARKDVPEETKKRLRATRAELDMRTLLHEIFLPRGCCCIRGVYWPGPTG